jgi:membrane associated rhomboid family serine protease
MFQSSPIVKKLFWANVILFIITLIGQNVMGFPIMNYLALFPLDSPNFNFYQFISSMFMHAGITHLLFNMLALLSFGPHVENQLGERKFILFYFIMGVGSSLLQMSLTHGPMIGASGAIFGVLVYFTMYNPEAKLSLFLLPIFVKAKNIMIFMILLEIIQAFTVQDGVGHWAHLGGALTGLILYKLDQKYQFNI